MGIFLCESGFSAYRVCGALLLTFVFLLNLRYVLKSLQAKNIINGTLLFSFWMLAGYLLYAAQNEINHPYYFANQRCHQVLLKISDHPEIKNQKFRCRAEIIQIYDSVQWKYASGNIILRFKTSDSTYHPSFGDIILMNRNDVQEIPKISVLGGFDYRKYLYRQNIHHKANPIPGKFVYCGREFHPLGFIQLIRLRQWLLNAYSQYFVSTSDQGLIAAMVFGYRQNLDPEISKTYTNTGVVHILAVSGLHVALVYGVLLFLTKFLVRFKLQKLRYFLLLACLIFYTLLTGCTASVCRASLMLSVFIFSDMLNRKSYGINTLSSSAFILLLVDPNHLFQAGFQLSYLAVAGILIFNPWVEQLYKPKYKWIQKIWSLLAVSISAQLSTLPLCLYLFHQFPVYFLLANLFVIPLSTGLLITASVIPFVLSVPILPKFLAYLCKIIMTLMDGILHYIESLPFHLIENIPFSSFSLFCTYGALIFLGTWMSTEKPFFLLPALTLALVWQTGLAFFKSTSPKQMIWYCLYSNYQPVPACLTGNTLHVFLDSKIHNDSTIQPLKNFELISEFKKLKLHTIELSGSGVTRIHHENSGIQWVHQLNQSHIEILHKSYPLIVLKRSYLPSEFRNAQTQIISSFSWPFKENRHHNLNIQGYWNSE